MYLDLDDTGSIHDQIARALKNAILDGRLSSGAKLPPTRELAQDLGVSRNTIISAYEQLRAEGFVEGRIGAGTFVRGMEIRRLASPEARPVSAQTRYMERARALDPGIGRRHYGLRYNLQFGEPLVSPSLLGAWSKELRRAAAYAHLDYPGAQGLPELRAAVAGYLARRRGIKVQGEDVLIVSGTQQANSLAARVLLDEGDRVVIEEPHYFALRQSLTAHGATIIGVRTDNAGMVCADLPDDAPRLICTTPSHQFPGGAIMSLERRLQLLRYATAKRCWILEDDYDSEFRYDVRPLAALRALDENRVIYVGSFSKVMFPSLRLGYMVLPRGLRDDFIVAKRLHDFGNPAIEQLALAGFISNGGFERHLHRATRALKRRRQALVRAVQRMLGGRVDIEDSHAGMHVVIWLRDFDPDQCKRLVDIARQRELGLYPIGEHYLHRPHRQGLLLGYASATEADIGVAIGLLAECMDEVMAETPPASLPEPSTISR